jgi:hypothetical protein
LDFRPIQGSKTAIVGAMKAILLPVALVALAGCATKAPHEASRAQVVAASDAPAIDACWLRGLKSPPQQALRARMGDYADSPTSVMKASRDRATTAEIVELVALQQDYLLPCRKLALESAGKVDPAIVAILAGSYAATDANYRRLATHEIAWGEFVSENQAIVTQRWADLLATGETLQRGVAASPAAAPAHGQAASALETWTRQQHVPLRGVPSPRVLDCHYGGSVLACTLS